MKTKQKIQDIINAIKQELDETFRDPTVRIQNAWWILEAITSKSKSALISQEAIELTHEQKAELSEWLKKITKHHMPMQYLLGSVPFADLEILVEPPVLIPRPETEEWTANLVAALKKLVNQDLTILDLCTGSGCIALALAKALPEALVYATDISDQALALAKKNALHNQITNVIFLQSDVYKNISQPLPDHPKAREKFDLIVSNPPYVADNQWAVLDISVTKWEDKTALVASEHGLGILKEIISHAPNWLRKNTYMQEQNIPQLIVEIGYQQAESVRNFMQQADFMNIQIKKDLFGKDRVVCGQLTKE